MLCKIIIYYKVVFKIAADRTNYKKLVISIIYCLFILRRNKCLNLYQNGLELKVTVTNLV